MSRSRSVNSRVPNPVRDAIEIRFHRGEYGRYSENKINRFDIGNDLYNAIFPTVHQLTIDVDAMPTRDQDAIHDFVKQCAEDNILIASLTEEKPLTAATLLRLAKAWKRSR